MTKRVIIFILIEEYYSLYPDNTHVQNQDIIRNIHLKDMSLKYGV